MLVKTAVSFILANSLTFVGAGAINVSDKNAELSPSTRTATVNTLFLERDDEILLYVDPLTGAYLGESLETKVETRVAPIIAWIGAIAVRLSAHAIRQMAARGISQALVKQAIAQGARSHANKGAWKYVMGKGKNRITVIVSKRTCLLYTSPSPRD